MERVVCTSGSSGDCEHHFLNFVYMSCEHIVKNGVREWMWYKPYKYEVSASLKFRITFTLR